MDNSYKEKILDLLAKSRQHEVNAIQIRSADLEEQAALAETIAADAGFHKGQIVTCRSENPQKKYMVKRFGINKYWTSEYWTNEHEHIHERISPITVTLYRVIYDPKTCKYRFAKTNKWKSTTLADLTATKDAASYLLD